MKIHLSDYCYDPDKNQIRTKGRKELARSGMIFALSLFFLFLIIVHYYAISWYFALLGLLPLVGLLRPFKAKVLFSKNGQVVSFFLTESVVELSSKGELHCYVDKEHVDSYFTHISYKDELHSIKLIDSPHVLSQKDFNLLFDRMFENLSYEGAAQREL